MASDKVNTGKVASEWTDKEVYSIDNSDSLIEIEAECYDFIEGDPSKMNNSPYPEVRQAVSTEFDPNVRLNHWRSWLLITAFVIVFAGVNQFFSLRYPNITLTYVVAQVISYPIGKALAKLPDIKCKIPFFDLRPGDFSTQEHALLVIVISLTASTSYAMNILIAQTNFYNIKTNVGYEILLVFSSQLLGFGVAGLTRRWIVYPASMMWPQSLVTSTLFHALAKSELGENFRVSKFKLSRYQMFSLAFIISFVWYWIPDFIFKGLSYFNWVCWIAPENTVVNQIFGVKSGLGVIPITFDWAQITQAMGVSPLATPFWVAANTYGSVFIFFIIIFPCLYYTNHWYAKYLPMISSSNYDNKQNSYKASKILGDNLRVHKEAYKNYSPLILPYSYLLSYGLNFAAITSIFTHAALYSGKDIIAKFRNAKHGGEDIHKRLMKSFKEVPEWWYVILFAVSIGLSFATIAGFYEYSRLPAWGLVIAFAIAFVGFIPQGLLEAMTNQHVGLNIITELIAGYVFPGNPLANMMIKLYGFIPMRHGLDFSRDLKLAQYMKVPPRLLFVFQVYGTIWACLVNVAVQRWMRFNINHICEKKTEFSCPNGRVIFNSSITYSLVGELFSPGKLYNPLLYFFVVGLFFPIVTFVLYKKFPRRWFGKINGPVFFTGSGNIPPSTLYNYSLYFATCFVFNFWLRKYYRYFHAKYNNILSAAFDSGVAISAIIIFLCVTYPGGKLNWWGNTVYEKTKDYKSAPFYRLKKGETFGPTSW